jgi:hypothetical protein
MEFVSSQKVDVNIIKNEEKKILGMQAEDYTSCQNKNIQNGSSVVWLML